MKSKEKYTYLPGDDKNNHAMLRVNQAGELGAVTIYRGQIAAQPGPNPTLQAMLAHEQVHLDYFNHEITKNRARPSIFYPLWQNLGFAIGYASAAVSPHAQHALTVGVELEISDHYNRQITQLPDGDLKNKIQQFKNDEDHHKDMALAGGAEQLPFYNIFLRAVRGGTRLAITIAEKL